MRLFAGIFAIRCVLILLCFGLLAASSPAATSPALAQGAPVGQNPLASLTLRVSVSTKNEQQTGSSFVGPLSISANGRYIVFASDASNLVSGDDNGTTDIFLRDTWLSLTSRVSTGNFGVEANGASTSPAISADGRFVVFQSTATNLDPKDSSVNDDIFRKNLLTGQVELVSFDSSNKRASYGYSRRPSISADGRYVAFDSTGDDIVPGHAMYYCCDVFVRDMDLHTTQRASVDSNGQQSSEIGVVGSIAPAISADGFVVAFVSNSQVLVSHDANYWDVFVHDLRSGQTSLVTVDGTGSQPPGEPDHFVSISGSGRYVAFSTNAKLVPQDNNFQDDVYVRDLFTGQVSRASIASDGTEGNQFSRYPAISYDGRFVSFNSYASNLVPGDTNNVQDIFVHDRLNGQTSRVSVSSDGSQANYYSYDYSSLSASGQEVVFNSDADNLVPLDTNGFDDTFVHFLQGDQITNNTISGQVLDSLGRPVPGVVVYDDQGDAAVTGQDGRYRINGLLIDSYSFKASAGSSDFTAFAPDQIKVPILYGNLTGQDFVAFHQIILLVHGIMTFDTGGGGDQCEPVPLGPYNLQTAFSGGHGNAPAYFGTAPDIFTAHGFKVYQAQLTTTPSLTPPIEENAACLARQVGYLLSKPENKGQKIILVAHSMGGLISRAYLNTLSPSEAGRMFSALYTFGSMHAGITTEYLVNFLLDRNPISGVSAAVFCVVHAGLCQFETPAVLRFNSIAPNQPFLSYNFVGGDSSDSGGWLLGKILLPFDGPNDGIVGQYSAVGQLYIKNCSPACPQTVRGSANRYWTGETHSGFMGIPAYFDGGNPISSTTSIDCLLVWLKQPGLCIARPPSAALPAGLASPSAGAAPALRLIASQRGEIANGLVISRTIQVDGPASALVQLTWLNGDAGLRLKTPAGLTITPAYAAQHPGTVSFEAQPASILSAATLVYSLTAPAPGVYTAVITAAHAGPAGALFTLSAFSSAPRILSLSRDKALYSVGDTAHLTATLAGAGANLAGAALSANVYRSDLVTDTLVFSPHSGVYTAAYKIPAVPGFLLINLAASGSDAGVLYDRQISALLSVADPSVSLTGVYSDQAALNPQTGKADTLQVNVGLNAARSGQFLLSGDLDAGGVIVAHRAISVSLAQGIHSAVLPFDGDELRTSGLDGPYRLVNLSLLDQPSGGTPLFWQMDSGYFTSAYPFAGFAATCYTLHLAHSFPAGGVVTPNTPPDCHSGTQYTAGAHLTLTASLSAGFHFAGWSGDEVGAGLSINVTMDRERTVVANYLPPTVFLPLLTR